MKTRTKKPDILDDRDHSLWIKTTIEELRSRKFDGVDWENVIEELASVERSNQRAIENLLTQLFEHLLKLDYWDSEREYSANRWKAEVRSLRKQLNREITASPSLKPYLVEIFPRCYQDAREILSDLSELPIDRFPEEAIYTVEQALDETWLPLKSLEFNLITEPIGD